MGFNLRELASRLEQKGVSYYGDMLEHFISQFHTDWDVAPDTDKAVLEFHSYVSKLSKIDFALLLICTGYIPEQYGHDSSEETLSTKLVEAVVCEWAKRIGFSDSKLIKQKSSKEDVYISDGRICIVCDAKSYRLGRSQKAPNVKDALKLADITKWMEAYSNAIGGLVTFPSLHNWKSGSDFYMYTTNSDIPTLVLFYEHMAFFYLADKSHSIITKTLREYANLFPKSSKDQKIYFGKVLKKFFGDDPSFSDYIAFADRILKALVEHQIKKASITLDSTLTNIKREVNATRDINILKEELIKYRYENATARTSRQLDNIKKFRL